MLAVRVPPAALVVGSAVRVGDVPVAIDGRELHVVLVLEGIAGVPLEAPDVEDVARVRAADVEILVLGVPVAAEDVDHVQAHGGAVVPRESVHGLQPEPVLRRGVAEGFRVVVEFPVELHGAVEAALEQCRPVLAPGVDGFSCGVDEILAGRSDDRGAVLGQLVDEVLVLPLDRLQLLHLPHQLRERDGLGVVGLGGIGLALQKIQ